MPNKKELKEPLCSVNLREPKEERSPLSTSQERSAKGTNVKKGGK